MNVDHYIMNLGPFKILYYEWKVNGGDGIPFIKHTFKMMMDELHPWKAKSHEISHELSYKKYFSNN